MRDNENIKLVTQKVSLVPYDALHVSKYHEWMQDEWIREMTASEPLSLPEEYDMQQSWREDAAKCTFIVLDRSLASSDTHPDGVMAGDVNLYFNDLDDDPSVAEIEVMVAEAASRRKGLAIHALAAIMLYAVQHLKARTFVAKILEHNAASRALFSKKLGFGDEVHHEWCGEVHSKRTFGSEAEVLELLASLDGGITCNQEEVPSDRAGKDKVDATATTTDAAVADSAAAATTATAGGAGGGAGAAAGTGTASSSITAAASTAGGDTAAAANATPATQ